MINKRLTVAIGLTAFLVVSIVIMVVLPPEMSVAEITSQYESLYNESERVITRVLFNSTAQRDYLDIDSGQELRLVFFEDSMGDKLLVDENSCFSSDYPRTRAYTLSGTINKASRPEDEVYYFKCDRQVI